MLRLLHETTDAVRRSIGMANVRKILRRREDVEIFNCTVKSAGLMAKEIGDEVAKNFKGWARQWARQGMLVGMKVRLIPSATKNIVDVMNNSTSMGKKQLSVAD